MARPASLDHREFGRAFLLASVTPERVADAVSRIAGETVELGPIRAGPGGRATVNARGRVGRPRAEQSGSEPLGFDVTLPVDVALEVKVGAVHRFDATVRIPLRLEVRVTEPLAIVIHVEPVRPGDIDVDISAHGIQARVLGRAGDVPGELRRHTAEYVNGRISDPAAARYTTIDLLPLIDRAWAEL